MCGELICWGVCVVFVGLFNVGKSLMFNAFVGCDVVIVLLYVGMIRDVLEVFFEFGGYKVIVSDIVGFCEIEDDVEKFGIV